MVVDESFAGKFVVAFGGDTQFKGGQFQKGHIVASAIESDELGFGIAIDPKPEFLNQSSWGSDGIVEDADISREKILAHPEHANRNRFLQGRGQKIRSGRAFRPFLFLGPGNGLNRFQSFSGKPYFSHQVAIGNGFNVKYQKGGIRRIGGGGGVLWCHKISQVG